MQDMVNVPLDSIHDMALVVSKEYGIPYNDVLDMYYSDMTVLYAKQANVKAFESYVSFISQSDEGKSKYIMDYGEPKPYVYSMLTPDVQKERLEDANGLRGLYKRGGRFND